MSFPIWVVYALIALIFWGITGVTQKLSTNYISASLSFLWFAVAFFPIALAILVARPLDWNLGPNVFILAAAGGALNGLGALTSFTALERGGKASVVIPLVYLYPLFTIFLARLFLDEKLTPVQGVGVVLAMLATFFLSRESPDQNSPTR